MDRFWLAHYPPGVRAEIDPDRYKSLAALLDDSFATYGTAPAFTCMNRVMTFAELDALSRALGAWLQQRGLKHGTRIAVMMPNVLAYPLAITALLRAGYVVVNVNPLYTPRELEFQLADSGAEAIVVLENFAAKLAEVVSRTAVAHILIARLGDFLGPIRGTVVDLAVRHVKKMVPPYRLPQAVMLRDAIAAGRGLTFVPATLGPRDIAFLQYTGGTTGVAKGAVLTHRNLIANTLQVDAWLGVPARRPPRPDPIVIVAALPLYHIFALTACFLIGMKIGALNLLIPNPRDIAGLLASVRRFRTTIFPAVNTLFNGMVHHRDFDTVDWSGLRCSIGGGMAVHKAVADAWFARTGCPIIEGYGLSETSPVLTCNRADITAWTGTIGLPLPSTDIAIRDDTDRDLPLGEAGEICGRGPQVMAGYWQRPDETARVMTPDGFFRTGDIGVMDATGQVRIVDRKKDMIAVSGFKVFPNEVEDVVANHPGVLECAAVGVPDERTGEGVMLFVVRRDPGLTRETLLAHCASQLAPYKLPRHVVFRSELPKSNVGKILRRALREEAPGTAPEDPPSADTTSGDSTSGDSAAAKAGTPAPRSHDKSTAADVSP